MKAGLFILALVAGSFLLAWKIPFPSATVRYRMTVEVETPEGIKSGSAVREVDMWLHPHILPEQVSAFSSVKGEAVEVDLGQRGVLFTLLTGGRHYSVLAAAFPSSSKDPLDAESIRHYASVPVGTTGSLKPVKYKELARGVTFKDLNDPKTVKSVNYEDMTDAFGSGVKIKQINIEITNDLVTWNLEKKLPWLQDYYNKMLDGQRYNTIKSEYPFANSLTAGVFSVGR
jgi:hypothetical protein